MTCPLSERKDLKLIKAFYAVDSTVNRFLLCVYLACGAGKNRILPSPFFGNVECAQCAFPAFCADYSGESTAEFSLDQRVFQFTTIRPVVIDRRRSMCRVSYVWNTVALYKGLAE